MKGSNIGRNNQRRFEESGMRLEDLIFSKTGAMSFYQKGIPHDLLTEILTAATSCAWLGRWRMICALPITQQDAVSACQGYTNNITTPSVNDHITVTGPYVLDKDHYNWAEIHPVYTLTVN